MKLFDFRKFYFNVYSAFYVIRMFYYVKYAIQINGQYVKLLAVKYDLHQLRINDTCIKY